MESGLLRTVQLGWLLQFGQPFLDGNIGGSSIHLYQGQ
jgi:hypothetical protein